MAMNNPNREQKKILPSKIIKLRQYKFKYFENLT